jgi:hypothetical protein
MTEITDAIKQAIESANPGVKVDLTQAPPAPVTPVVPPHVAANICKMLERVQVTGVESVAWVEAYQTMRQFVPQGPGVPFVPHG